MRINQFYSRRHFQLVSPPDDTPTQIAERLRENAIWAQVERERLERFPVVTLENFDEIIRWRDARVAVLRQRGSAA